MEEIIDWIMAGALLAACFVSLNVGANDTANCVGPSVGSGILSFRKGVWLTAIFLLLGALLQGQSVTQTLGKGIMLEPIAKRAILASLLCAGLFLALTIHLKLPVSASQCMIGAMTGVGLCVGAPLRHDKLFAIVECWVVCPLLTMIASFLLYHGTASLLRRLKKSHRVDKMTVVAAILSSCYMAYSAGANHLGIPLGPLLNGNFPLGSGLVALLMAISLALGAFVFSHGVTETMGKSITPMNVVGAFSAQASAALAIHSFSMLGIPVSSSQAIVGGIVGVGLVKGVRSVSKRTLSHISLGWVLVPVFAGGYSFLAYRLVQQALSP